MQLSTATCTRLAAANTSLDKLLVLLGATEPHDWELLGGFLGKVRQARRKDKVKFEQRAKEVVARRFMERKAAWKASGKTVCRHGVFWRTCLRAPCPCLAENFEHTAWLDATWMPALDHASKNLVVTPFDAQWFRRLGFLRAEMRRLGW